MQSPGLQKGYEIYFAMGLQLWRSL